jgi:hypothetical protein
MRQHHLVLGLLFSCFMCSTAHATVNVSLFGPQSFSRHPGKPILFSAEFPGRPGLGRLIIKIGGQGPKTRIRRAAIKLNGVVVELDRFRRQSNLIKVPISIAEHNKLVVELQCRRQGERDGDDRDERDRDEDETDGLFQQIVSFLSVEVTEVIDADGASVIGPSGGTVSVSDIQSPTHGVELVIPPGAIISTEVVSISSPPPDHNPQGPPGYQGGVPIELKPAGLTFSSPATLNIPSGGLTARNYYVFNEVQDSWDMLGTYLDTTTGKFQVLINHFSTLNTWCSLLAGVPCRSFQPFSTVTYSIDPTSAFASGYTPDEIDAAIRSAVAKWAQVLSGRLAFTEVQGQADVQFSWSSQLPPGVLALTSLQILGPNRMEIRFNDSGIASWCAINADACPKMSIEAVALHEFGHALGLAHICLTCGCVSSNSVMAASQTPCAFCVDLKPIDITMAQALYPAPPISFLTFVEGDPGVPGDGILIDANGGKFQLIFELAKPIPLRDIADGFTYTVFFPAASPQLRYVQLGISNLQTTGSCRIFFAARPAPSGNVILNGVPGMFTNVAVSDPTQDSTFEPRDLNSIVAFVNKIPGCTNLTLNDLYFDHLLLEIATPPGFLTTLDAAAIGPGPYNFPGTKVP